MEAKNRLKKKIRDKRLDIRIGDNVKCHRWNPWDAIKNLTEDSDDVEMLLKETTENHTDKDSKALKEFTINKAQRLFALLVQHDRLRWLHLFYDGDFDDGCFPIQQHKQDKHVIHSMVENKKSEDTISFPDTDIDDIETLCDTWQWQFFVPVFGPKDPTYAFHPDCHLPYIREVGDGENEGGKPLKTNNSIVKHFVMHRSHLTFPDDSQIGTVQDEDENPHVAVKELLSAQGLKFEEFKEIVENEVSVLTRFRRQQHPHLITAIASYSQATSYQANRYFFIFPWARGGNLREFWRNQPSLSDAALNFSPEDWNVYLEWFFRQLSGLASAMKCLHHPENEIGVSCRHGDLKPENILCFSKIDPGPGKIPTDVNLVIADAGHAKVHEKATELRGNPTTTPAGTKLYCPPEAEASTGQLRSRRYDIWSLGCLYLEFLIWILYGNEFHGEFLQALQSAGTYYVTGATVGLNDIVKSCIHGIKENPRCFGRTALRRLVELIETRFLVVNVSTRRNSLPSPPELQADVLKTHEDTLKSRAENPVPGVVLSRPTIKLSNHDSERAGAMEMYEELKKIYDAAVGGTIPWINHNGIEEAEMGRTPQLSQTLSPQATQATRLSLPGGRQSVSQALSIRSNKYMFTPLDNTWVYNPDRDIARRIVVNGASTAQKYGISSLCNRCETLELWSKTCAFSSTLAELKESHSCDLCRLLYEVMVKRAAFHEESIKFFRIGSNLTFAERQSSPILSLCTQAESETLSSNDVQLGLPSLATPGHDMHITILSEWIKGCNEHQHSLADNDFVPTRLLAVGDEKSRRVQLVCNLKGKVKYVALSHRWGSKEQTKPYNVSFEVTNKHTISRIQHPGSIDEADLPKTFRDAVIVTRKLKVDYLWIDSLCILQKTDPDDEVSAQDWDTESKLMEKVYSSAYFTIAASCAEHRFDGFLKPRTPRNFVTMTTGPFHGNDEFHVCEVIDNFHGDVERGELNKRGWVLQERALSRRTIHFTATQTYWECGGGIRCETFKKAKNLRASFLGDSNFPRSIDAYKEGKTLQLYQDLYEQYTTLGLSYPTDRPRAIAGLEKRLMNALECAGGYGIFQSKKPGEDSHFHRNLLWHRQRSKPSLKKLKFEPHQIQVPSWSWMAFEGEIRYMNVPFGDIKREAAIMSPFDNLSAGELYPDIHPTKLAEIQAPVHALTVKIPDEAILDIPHRKLTHPLECVIVGTSKTLRNGQHTHYSLIVHLIRKEEGELDIYERLGVAYLKTNEIRFNKSLKSVRIR